MTWVRLAASVVAFDGERDKLLWPVLIKYTYVTHRLPNRYYTGNTHRYLTTQETTHKVYHINIWGTFATATEQASADQVHVDYTQA